MSQKAPWFRFNASRWLGTYAIRVMTPEERGMRIQLFCEAWESDPPGTLPTDPDVLWRLAGAKSRKRFEAISEKVLRDFQIRDNRYFIPELIEQANGLRELSETRRIAGLAGLKGRWPDSKCLANAITLPSQTHGYQIKNRSDQNKYSPGSREWVKKEQQIAAESDIKSMVSNLSNGKKMPS